MKLKRLVVSIVLLSLLVSMFAGCQPQFQPGDFTDDVGRVVTMHKVPERIVSHVPSITETLFALGLGERVVGVSDYCDYPEEAKLKPSVGNYYNPTVEKIVELEPDLVLTDGYSEGLIVQLEDLGITSFVINPKDIDHILRDIELVGKITGTEERAKELLEDMQKRISRVLNQVKDAPRVKVFYVFDATDLNSPWTAGPGSIIDSLISMAGGENIAAKAEGSWVQFSIEALVNSDPEIIIIDAHHGTAVIAPAALKEHPVWGRTSAVKEGRVFAVDGDLVNRNGYRIVQGLEEVAKIIHPELFE